MAKKTLTASYVFLLAAEIIYYASAYFIVAGLGRFLGPAEYGRYSIVVGAATMVTILVARGIPTAMMKRISENPESADHALSVRAATIRLQTPLVLGLSIFFFFLCPLIAQILGDSSLTPLLRISTLIIPFFALSSFYVLYLNGLKSFRALAVIKALRGITRIAAVLALAYLYGTEGAIIGAALAPLTLFLIAIFLATLIEPTRFKKDPSTELPRYDMKKLLSYAWGFMFFLFLYEFYMRADLYLIKAIIGDDATIGYYDAAVKIALLPYFGIYALTLILFPTMSELASENSDSAKKQIRKLLKNLSLIGIATLPLGAFIIYLVREPLVLIIFGEKFLPATEYIPYMLGATIFGTVFYVLASILNGAGHTRITWSILIVSLVVSITLNLVYIPILGPTAAAMTFSLSTLLMGVSSAIATYRIFYRK